MSLFQHLVERALELARPVEPVVDPSPLGPPTLGPSEPTFDQTIVEQPAARVRTPEVAAPGIVVAPSSSPIVQREAPSAVAPITSAAPRVGVAPQREPASVLPNASEREHPAIIEPKPASVIVERRVEQRVERTHERVLASTVTVEPRVVESPVRERTVVIEKSTPAEPREPSGREPSRIEQRVIMQAAPAIAEPVRPLAPTPERATIASPAVPARRDVASPRPAAPLESRRAQQPAPESSPTLRIEIGRVIVRAESPASPQRPAAASARPLTTLAEYLANRDRGSR